MLKSIRKSKNITQKEVAAFLGVTQVAISDWESGRRKPDYKTLQKLADFYGVSVDYILGRDKSPVPPDLMSFAQDEDGVPTLRIDRDLYDVLEKLSIERNTTIEKTLRSIMIKYFEHDPLAKTDSKETKSD